MYALCPNGRKRQQVLLQQLNNQRNTRQIDSKNQRQTFNSRNEKLLNIDQDVTIKKKQKLHQNNTCSNNIKDENNDDFVEESIPIAVSSADVVQSAEIEKENIKATNMDLNYKCHNSVGQNNSNMYSLTPDILGQGHLDILHAYVRETLFRNIKILSPSHLETNGQIMKEMLQLLNYSSERNGNLTAFVHACQMEIRKTICARRGYVKRQTGLLLAGKSFLHNIITELKCLINFSA